MSESTILYCHLDNFYASVEQYDQARLQGQPVVVGALPFPQGRAVSVSPEARDFGLHPSMPIKTAYQLCPQATYVTADFTKYQTFFEKILYLYADFTDRVEPAGLGKAFLDVSGCDFLTRSQHNLGQNAPAHTATVVAQQITTRLREEYGFSVSIGIAASKGVARIASHCRRPASVTIVPAQKERAFLARLPISYLELDPSIQQHLTLLGISAIGQLAALPEAAITRKFGPYFTATHRLANGIDSGAVAVLRLPPAVDAEVIFDFSDKASQITSYLPVLIDQVAQQLQEKNWQGRVVVLRLYTAGPPLTMSTVLKSYTAQRSLLLLGARRVLSQAPPDTLVEGMKLAISDLMPPQMGQLPLFPNNETRRRAIKEAIAGLKQRHGPKTLLRVIYDPMAILTENTFYLAEVENDEPSILPTRSRNPKKQSAQQSFLAG